MQNDSNVALNVTFAFTADDALSPYGLTGSFKRSDDTVVDATARVEKATKLSVTLTLQSLYPKAIENKTEMTKLGELTIRLTTIKGGDNG